MIMQSSGGIMTSDEARPPSVRARVRAGRRCRRRPAVARRLGRAQAISFDMGGTTAKASLIEHGDILRSREYEAGGTLSVGSRLLRGGGELLRIPTIDIAEVGAGGGSIAWIDAAAACTSGLEAQAQSPARPVTAAAARTDRDRRECRSRLHPDRSRSERRSDCAKSGWRSRSRGPARSSVVEAA